MKAFTLAVVGLAALVSAYPDADKVTELDQMPDLSFGLYSGYVPIPDSKKKLHYMAALSQRDPKTDPIIIWFNGGPGCSSMLGFAQENGPYALEDGDANFRRNDYAWNQEATMFYLESPAGVGYSVCGDATQCKFDDNNSADDNL
jgi:cathepsin A (carboxypeptidase C)